MKQHTEQHKVQTAYDNAAKVYHHTVSGDHQRISARHLLADIFPPPAPGESVLDVGCGTGICLFVFLELYPEAGRAVGMDLSNKMLDTARSESEGLDHPIEWVQGDAQHLAFPDNSFDLIISHNAFHWFPDRLGALKEMLRVLKPGGRIALVFEAEGARRGQLGIRQLVLARHGLQPPGGFGTSGKDSWNTLDNVEALVKEAGFDPIDIWVRTSYTYLPVSVVTAMFNSTSAYWSRGLSPEQTAEILAEIKAELEAKAGERGFQDILAPLNVIAQKPE